MPRRAAEVHWHFVNRALTVQCGTRHWIFNMGHCITDDVYFIIRLRSFIRQQNIKNCSRQDVWSCHIFQTTAPEWEISTGLKSLIYDVHFSFFNCSLAVSLCCCARRLSLHAVFALSIKLGRVSSIMEEYGAPSLHYTSQKRTHLVSFGSMPLPRCASG